MKKQIEKILREAGRKAVPLEDVRDVLDTTFKKSLKKTTWNTWHIEKITKDFKITIKIEQRI